MGPFTRWSDDIANYAGPTGRTTLVGNTLVGNRVPSFGLTWTCPIFTQVVVRKLFLLTWLAGLAPERFFLSFFFEFPLMNLAHVCNTLTLDRRLPLYSLIGSLSVHVHTLHVQSLSLVGRRMCRTLPCQGAGHDYYLRTAWSI